MGARLSQVEKIQMILNFLFEIEFYAKVAIICAVLQQFSSWLLHDIELSFIAQAVLYWLVSSVSFYVIGLFIEKVIKKNEYLRDKLNCRVQKVKKQPFPAFTVKGIVIGQVQGLITALIILYLAPEVQRGNGLVLNLGWFFMRIIAADFCFYVAHWLLHRKIWLRIHLKHHEFADSSSFVAGHKSLIEYIIVTITDILPVFIFGYDITQILAWTVIGNAYNLEGHSSLSIFFIASDFHDLHHTSFKGNYGIQGFWDRVFNTLNPPTKKSGIISPVASLEKTLVKLSSRANKVTT